MLGGKAFDMQFIDQRSCARGAQLAVIVPAKGGVNHHRLGHKGRAVAFIKGEVAIFMADGVAKECVIPLQFAGNRFGVGVKQ